MTRDKYYLERIMAKVRDKHNEHSDIPVGAWIVIGVLIVLLLIVH
jgi:tRNA(Arg) A34 adenosine deaminase TadA